MSKRIVVLGSSNTDMTIHVGRLPDPGETVIGDSFSMAPGGKGANQAVAAARAGGDVTFIARVGDDQFGEQAIMGFARDNINVDHVIKDADAPSGVALICVDEAGENSIAVASGANAKLSPADVEAAREVIKSADVLVMQLEIPLETIQAAIAIAAEHRVKIILNPAPAQLLSDDILRHISVLTPNESEAELLTGIAVTGESDARMAGCALVERGVETVLITLGAGGVFASNSSCGGLVAGFEVRAVDTTAAGDVFNGALAVAIAEGASMREAIVFANAAGALSVTRMGAQPSAPKRNQIDAFQNDRQGD